MNVVQLSNASRHDEEKKSMLDLLTKLLLDCQEDRLTQFVGIFVIDEEYKSFRGGASKVECIAMASMLHHTALEWMKA